MRVSLVTSPQSLAAWTILLLLWLDALRQLRVLRGAFEDLTPAERRAGIDACLEPEGAASRLPVWASGALGLLAVLLLLRCLALGMAGHPLRRGADLTEAGRLLGFGLYVLALAGFGALEVLRATVRRDRAEAYLAERARSWRGHLGVLFDQRNRRDPALPESEAQLSVTTPFPLREGGALPGRLEFLQIMPGERLVLVAGPSLDLRPAYRELAARPEHIPSLDLTHRSIRLVDPGEIVRVEFRRSGPRSPEGADRGHLILALLSGETLLHELEPRAGEEVLSLVRPRIRPHVRPEPSPGLRVVAEAGAPEGPGRRPCPLCAEAILPGARLCRYCGSDLRRVA